MGLAHEPADRLGRGEELAAEQLDRGAARRVHVLCGEHDAHPPDPEHPLDPIRADEITRSSQEASSIGCCREQLGALGAGLAALQVLVEEACLVG